MSEYADTTYRVFVIENREAVGQTAATPELAKLVAPRVDRTRFRLGLERTDWGEQYGKPRAVRSVLIDAESRPGEWELGS